MTKKKYMVVSKGHVVHGQERDAVAERLEALFGRPKDRVIGKLINGIPKKITTTNSLEKAQRLSSRMRKLGLDCQVIEPEKHNALDDELSQSEEALNPEQVSELDNSANVASVAASSVATELISPSKSKSAKLKQKDSTAKPISESKSVKAKLDKVEQAENRKRGSKRKKKQAQAPSQQPSKDVSQQPWVNRSEPSYFKIAPAPNEALPMAVWFAAGVMALSVFVILAFLFSS